MQQPHRGSQHDRLPRRVLSAVALALAMASGASAQIPAAAPSASAAVSAVPALTRPAKPLPASFFFQRPDIAQTALSPHGRKVAVVNAVAGTGFGIAVLDLHTGKLTRVAQFAAQHTVRLHWVDDHQLLYTARPDASFRTGVFVVNADGTDARQLVSHSGRVRHSQGRRILDANHHLLHVPITRAAASPREVLIAEQEPDGGMTPLWLNTDTGKTRSSGIALPRHAYRLVFDLQGVARVVFTRHPHKLQQSAYWRESAQSEWQRLYETDTPEPPFEVTGVGPAGELFVTSPQGPRGEMQLSRYDFARGAPDPKPLVQTPGFDFKGEVVPSRDGRLLGWRFTTDSEQTLWFDPAMKALQAEADRRHPDRVNTIACARCGEPDMVALVFSRSDRDPGQYWLHQANPAAGDAAWRLVGRTLRMVRDDVVAKMATMGLERIQARDGRDLPVWVTTAGDATGPQPAVVLVHGGPWVRGATWQWRSTAQFLASRGYVVIEPEFRGSAGYGREHLRAGDKQWGAAMQDDIADALLWAQAQGLASDKACIVGSSYGGYAALMGLARHAPLYRCGAAHAALTDLDLLLNGAWWVGDDNDMARKERLPALVGDPVKDAALLKANSPVNLAAQIKVPVMLVYGEDDWRVPIAHGQRMRKALSEAGNEPVWVAYANEGHGFQVDGTRLDYIQRLETFLAQHLKP